MDANLINPFINATVNVLKTMASIDPKPGKPYVKETNSTWGIVSGVMGMAGDQITGNLIVGFDEHAILEIVSAMLMTEFTEITGEVEDAVGELTNMIMGGAKMELANLGMKFEMATPMMITGRNIVIRQLTKTPLIAVPFDTVHGRFVVESNLAASKK